MASSAGAHAKLSAEPFPGQIRSKDVGFVRVASVEALRARRGRGLCVRFGRIDIGLFAVGTRIYAMENRCPHADAPLSDGELEGTVVTCPLHGWRIDVTTGRRPEDGDGFPLPCFAARVTGDDIEIDIDQELNARRPRAAPRCD
jgi:nitrite reductase/ring-hydroxylating ferredoxin subunit